MPDDLRTRIAAVLYQRYVRTLDVEYSCMEWMEWEDIPDKEPWLADADAVIRELDSVFLDFALWLSEELRGEPLSRIDAESCLQEWKWLNDESRWLKDGD